jgi:hypothetical protein
MPLVLKGWKTNRHWDGLRGERGGAADGGGACMGQRTEQNSCSPHCCAVLCLLCLQLLHLRPSTLDMQICSRGFPTSASQFEAFTPSKEASRTASSRCADHMSAAFVTLLCLCCLPPATAAASCPVLVLPVMVPPPPPAPLAARHPQTPQSPLVVPPAPPYQPALAMTLPSSLKGSPPGTCGWATYTSGCPVV